jgi:hypothetical protein
VDLVFFGEALDGIDFVLRDASAQMAGHSNIERTGAAGEHVNPEFVIGAITHCERW